MMKNGQYKYLLVRMLRSWIIVSISAHKPYIKADTNAHKGRNAVKNGQYKYLSEKQLQILGLCAQTPLCTLGRALNIGLNSRSICCIKKETQPLNIFPILPKLPPQLLILPAPTCLASFLTLSYAFFCFSSPFLAERVPLFLLSCR